MKMDRVLLKRINIISIALVLVAIIVFSLPALSWPLVLIEALPIPYMFILFFVNIRKSVLDQVGVYKKADGTLDETGKKPLSIIRNSLYVGVLAITILSGALLWYMEPEQHIYGLLLIMALFLLTCLYLARLIDLSYTAEYYSSKSIRINYSNITIAAVLFVALGIAVFIYLRYQLAWYFIGITLLFLGVIAYDRARKTINFLKYINNKPLNTNIEQSLRIFNSLAFLALIVAYFFYPYLTLNIGSTIIKIGIFTVVLQTAIVVNLAKAIMDIS
ncbi:hypothetical protein MCP_1166 [Methanocella paludicola SANAE]|uniref:Uncharacterized protein n=1 Tax=Methanocella paludicola (strain DSM 17711 / JCM 13418 / NBRC 101707 / SANAE) TaxID=304371 RepID=D1YXR6_METPS|nr:hypothetical protein [Methanocella paludicola]BAI61238.1 hypothetical protein MCP_1166 [Methanocella paludicola SANAE]